MGRIARRLSMFLSKATIACRKEINPVLSFLVFLMRDNVARILGAGGWSYTGGGDYLNFIPAPNVPCLCSFSTFAVYSDSNR